jgi:UDP-glucose 4-epimerase
MSAARKRGQSVLITGASAPIGERLVRSLLDDSRIRHIIAVTGHPPEHFPVAKSDRLTVVQVDLKRSREVHDLLFGPARDYDVEVVVHTAMHLSAMARGGRVHAFNVDSVRNLLELCERHPTIQRVVLRSASAVYQVQRDLPLLIAEDHPLNMARNAPQWVRDRVEADLTACVRMGVAPLEITVLRMAEALAPGTGSQMFDFLLSPVCLHPAGFDPMINLLTIDDTVHAINCAIQAKVQGVFNIPGADTLPLTTAIRRWGRVGVPTPDNLLGPLYRLRRRLTGSDFRYGMNRRWFIYSGVLDGTRAQEVLGYVPSHPIDWPAAPTPPEDL